MPMNATFNPSRAAGKDDGRGADGKRGAIHQFFNLVEFGNDVGRENEIGIDFTRDEEVERFHKRGIIIPRFDCRG